MFTTLGRSDELPRQEDRKGMDERVFDLQKTKQKWYRLYEEIEEIQQRERERKKASAIKRNWKKEEDSVFCC